MLSRARTLHRLIVPVAAVPIILVSLSGALYGVLLNLNIEAPWLLKLHTGNFGWFNLQPLYSPILGVLTLILAVSGLLMLRPPQRRPSQGSSR